MGFNSAFKGLTIWRLIYHVYKRRRRENRDVISRTTFIITRGQQKISCSEVSQELFTCLSGKGRL